MLDYLLLPLLGTAWTIVAITVANARQKNISVIHFYLIGSAGAFLIFTAMSFFSGMENVFAPQYRVSALAYFFGALMNASGQGIVMYNLKKGGRAVAVVIPQLAFILPYIWCLFHGDTFTPAGASGLLAITVAVTYLSLKKSNSSAENPGSSLDPKRLLVAFCAMLIVGTGQILIAIPVVLKKGGPLSPMTGSMIIQFATMLLFALLCAFSPDKFIDSMKKAVKSGLMWSLGAAASYCILLPALKCMGARKQSGIVYPIGCSMVIVLFALYASICYREKLSRGQIAAFIAIVIGIFLIRM